MTDHDKIIISRMALLIVILMLIQLGVIGYVFYASYQGREALVKTQQRGCERGILDRTANATGWRIAEGARLASGDIAVARKYQQIASSLEKRSTIDCAKAYPKAGIFP